jgi:hypothetical protein
MARLLDLPDEILLEALSFTDHEDIEAFTSCCKRLYGVGRDVRTQHFERKDNYGTIVCGDVYADGTPTTHPLKILQGMINDEILFSYPTKMIILECSRDNPNEAVTHWSDTDLEQAYEKIVDEIIEAIPKVLRRSPYFGHQEVVQDLDWILSGAIEPVVALLLTILPNLQSIEMRNYTRSIGDDVDEILKDLVKANAALPSMRHSLPKLSSVYMYGGQTEGDGNEYEEFDRLQPYIGLPSMRHLGGSQVRGLASGVGQTRPQYKWDRSLENFGTHITSVEFTHSMIEAERFDNILESVKELGEFKYGYDNRLNDYMDTDRSEAVGWWEPKGIIGVLLKYTSHSLVSLDLTGCTKAPAGSYYAVASFVGSLQGFEKLERLRIDNELFVESQFEAYVACRLASWKSPIKKSEQEEIDRKRMVEKMHPDKNEWEYAEIQVRHARLVARFNKQGEGQKRDRAHRLADVLPASLVELRLCMPFRKGIGKLMFDSFLDLKETMLPHLSKIAFEDVNTAEAKFGRACQKLGIELEYRQLDA